jgi:pyridoxal phosphate enzyme (YggS family)
VTAPLDPGHIGSNLADVRGRLERAARTAGRDPSSIRLVAISKTFPADAVRAAFAAGQRVFGENRVQDGLQKMTELADLPIEWHLVGHLQTNKARKSPSFHCIHSVDSLELLQRIDRAAVEARRTPDVLVQVDLAGESTKFGAPDEAVETICRADLQAVHLRGLMLLPPYADNPEDARPWFRQLRALRNRLLEAGIPPGRLQELSMGMSHDFEIAVEEGSTMVRVGTAIFGDRRQRAGTEKG